MAETQLDILIEVYHEAQLSLIGIISSPSVGAGTKTYYNTVLKQLEALMDRLSAETGKYIETAVPAEYRKALDETYDYFQKNKLRMKRPDMFAQIHSDAVYELSREMQYHINQGISLAGRRVMRYLDESRDNILRQQGLRSAAVKIASGQTVLDMQKNLMQRLANDGFLTVQYGSGDKAYQVGLDTYAAMVARSTTREAGNLARENQLVENGYDLMKMTEHYPTCEKCAQLQGRVYSISGRDKRFPPMSIAFSGGYRNVHPNCRHVMTYWIEELQSPEELAEALERSGALFEDCRSDSEKALYSKQQAENRRMRADRSQYERYKARLGEGAPKTFSSFRRMKNQGGEKWQDLQKLYQSKYEPAEVDVPTPSNNGGTGKLYEPEKIPDKAVDNPGESGIIEETSKKPITPITDSSIDRVTKVEIAGYTDEQCSFIQKQHKELLEYSRQNNDNKEVAFVFDRDLKNRREFTGANDRLDFGSALYGKDLFVMHNHPRNSSYSLNDIVEFIGNDSIKTLTIVKNNGSVESLTKLGEYDKLALLKELQRLEKKSIKTGSDSEYRKIVDKFLNKYVKGGFLEWQK